MGGMGRKGFRELRWQHLESRERDLNCIPSREASDVNRSLFWLHHIKSSAGDKLRAETLVIRASAWQ